MSSEVWRTKDGSVVVKLVSSLLTSPSQKPRSLVCVIALVPFSNRCLAILLHPFNIVSTLKCKLSDSCHVNERKREKKNSSTLIILCKVIKFYGKPQVLCLIFRLQSQLQESNLRCRNSVSHWTSILTLRIGRRKSNLICRQGSVERDDFGNTTTDFV